MTPSVNATEPMVFFHSMGINPFVFTSGTSNHDTQPIPWASNHFYHGMPNMSLHFPSYISSPYMNLNFGSKGMMPPFSPFSFGGSHIPHPILTLGDWNIPSYKSNLSFTFQGESAQMGGNSIYYIPSIYLLPLCQFL
jgi:hypothetical protein